MKKLIALLLASLMILGLCSCKKESADSIYSRICENTLALEYVKLNVSVYSTVEKGGESLTIPTDSEVKIINQNGEISYLSTSIVRFMVEGNMARVTLQHYYKDGWLYQSAGDVKMKHELSAEKLFESNIDAKTLILKLPSDLLAGIEVETEKKAHSFMLDLPDDRIDGELKGQLDQIMKLYSEAKFDNGSYTLADLKVTVTTTTDDFLSLGSITFTASGKVSGEDATETITVAYEVVNPGSYFAMEAPYAPSQYEEGEFSIK